MIEHLWINGRDRYKIVCDVCLRPIVAGVYPTKRKARQAAKSAGRRGEVCEKCEREGKTITTREGGKP